MLTVLVVAAGLLVLSKSSVAVFGVGIGGLEVSVVNEKGAEHLTASLPKDVTFEDLKRSIRLTQARSKGQVRWGMNIPKDQLPIVGPPMGTAWTSARHLWDQDMVGLYFVYENDEPALAPAGEKEISQASEQQLKELLK